VAGRVGGDVPVLELDVVDFPATTGEIVHVDGGFHAVGV
jgi:enoyl-[acyl-carrier-protein] reductase (NADH)